MIRARGMRWAIALGLLPALLGASSAGALPIRAAVALPPANTDSLAAVFGADDDSADVAGPSTPVVAPSPARSGHLEPLVPELAGDPYRLAPGVRPYQYRLSLSPAFGNLGAHRLFSFRVAYYPNSWLGYEGAVDHNPGQSVHALVNSINAILRRPLPGRLQPYVVGGYGMIVVYPGEALKADAVTKNALNVGGGSELFIRGDLALRGEVRAATVIGRQTSGVGTAAYDYLQWTIGLAFYRSIRP